MLRTQAVSVCGVWCVCVCVYVCVVCVCVVSGVWVGVWCVSVCVVCVCVYVPCSWFRTRYGAKAAGSMKKGKHFFLSSKLCIFQTSSCSYCALISPYQISTGECTHIYC